MSSPANSPTADAGAKSAMSRALGAAFLNHQVQELERAVANGPRRNINTARGRGRGGGYDAGRGGGRRHQHRKHDSEDTSGDDQAMLPADVAAIVLDASVLIHAPAQVKRWCKDNMFPDLRLVVPLEVLNTLDLLKKGTSVLSQRARAASRLLESFVGADTRMRVQRDEAFVLWDDVQLIADDDDALPPPEWLRRTLCCASWEATHAATRSSVLVAVVDPAPLSDPDSAGRYDIRADGALVRNWVPRVGLRLLPVKPSASAPPRSGPGAGAGAAVVPDKLPPTPIEPEPILVTAPVTVPRLPGKLFDPNATDGDAAIPRMLARRGSDTPAPQAKRGGRRPASARVQKPAHIVSPPKEKDEPMRVVRLLARGEKLDP